MNDLPFGTPLLAGIVGSVAYGLDHGESDVDRLGVYAAPTYAVLGLHPPGESHVRNDPDVTWHEARKFLGLALKANPTITELLWLENYETVTSLGLELIEFRLSLLAAPRVRAAYLGYATQQFRRLENRGDGSFSSDTRKRTAKHARHLLRLLRQGDQLYRDGRLSVKLDDPETYRDFGDAVAAGDLELARRNLAMTERLFDEAHTPLPEHPDEKPAGDWLLRVRREYW